MTEIDDRELSQRLRALRVDPPTAGFEARLAERLLATAPEPRPQPRGRVIVGPWLRRGPARLIGATALLLAGAAAAVEGGVVEWVQARVESVRSEAPASPPPLPSPVERASSPRRERRVPTPPPADAIIGAPQVEPPPPAPEQAPDVPRLGIPERRLDRAPRSAPAPEPRGALERSSGPERPGLSERDAPVRRPALDPGVIPRLAIEPRRRDVDDPDTRLGRGMTRPGAGAAARERGRDIERIRDIAKVRRERAAAGDERPRVIDRIRERREHIDAERREMMRERNRRDRPSR